MRIVLQRVSRASVTVDGEVTGEIGRGYLLLVAAGREDAPEQIAWLADKIVGLRVFSDAQGKMNLPLAEVDGAALVVSQFTLYGDVRKGRRPSWLGAAPPEQGAEGVEAFARALEERGVRVERGRFGAHMDVELNNDGPVTLLLDSEKTF
ncbi:MAG: D-aminoacyl-tRNA deacylase [Actinomycetota bacterium]